jgi:hypothetical protein
MDSSEQLKEEIQEERAELAQHEAELEKLTMDEPTVWLRHPNTGDVQQVPGTPECLIPLMGRGYQQFTPAAPVKEESK